MVSMMVRFVASVVGVLLFITLVDQPPVFVFVLAFFLGFAVLTAMELKFLLKQSPNGTHA